MCGRFELALVSLRLDVSNCQCVMLPTRQKQSLPNRLRFEMHRVHYLAIHRGRKVAHSSSIVLRPPNRRPTTPSAPTHFLRLAREKDKKFVESSCNVVNMLVFVPGKLTALLSRRSRRPRMMYWL
jgi:hypothetical protein